MLFELPDHDVLYQALCERNSDYEGKAFVCVKTTGIFCRLTCPARNPKSKNCVFVETIAECIECGFRPCKRCNPLAPEATADTSIQLLLKKLAWIIHEDSAFRGNLAKQVGPSSEKRGPPRAEEDGPRCDARFSLTSNRHTAFLKEDLETDLELHT